MPYPESHGNPGLKVIEVSYVFGPVLERSRGALSRFTCGSVSEVTITLPDVPAHISSACITTPSFGAGRR